MSEIAFEKLGGIFEVVRGTALAAPDHYARVIGAIDPVQAYKEVDQGYGLLADNTDESQLVRQWATWSGDGDADTSMLPWWFNLAVKGSVTAPTTPQGIGTFTVTAGGTGYVAATTVVSFTGGTGIGGASAVATVAAGIITSITPTNPGQYTAAPTVVITGGGTGATATVVLGTAATAKLWTFNATETADDLSTFTGFFGDPNVQMFQAPFCALDNLVFTADASATDVVKIKPKGMGNFPIKVSNPAWPAAGAGHFLIPQGMQLWIDLASAAQFGGTAITGRLISAEIDIPTGFVYKYLAQGPGSALNYVRLGRKKRHTTTKLVFEFLDTAQYDLAVATAGVPGGSRQKVRLQFNGALIETVSGAPFYHFAQFDILGRMNVSKWGSHLSANRSLELDIISSYRIADATSFTARVQGVGATL